MGTFPSDIPSEQVQVQPTTGLGMDASPDAYGARVGQSLRNLGSVESRLFRDEEARQDNVAVMAAYNKMSDWALTNLYHPDTGILNKNLGADTAPAVDKTLADYDSTMSKVRADLAPRQQEAFDRMQKEHYFQIKHQLYGYEAKQSKIYANEQTVALIQNQQDAAVQHARVGDLPGDESSAWARRVEANLEVSSAAIMAAGHRNGDSAEVIQQQLQANASTTHMGVISELMANDRTADAKAWYSEHASELTKHDAIQAAGMFRIATVHDDARALNDSILAEQRTEYEKSAPVPDPAGILGPQVQVEPTLAGALAKLEARGIKDTAVYDQTKQRLKQYYTEEAAANRAQQMELAQQADDQLRDPTNNYEISADILGKMDPKTLKFTLANQKSAREGGNIVSNESVKLRLRTMAADPSQWDEFASYAAVQFDADLNKADRNEYLANLAHVRGQIDKRDQHLSQGIIATQVATHIFQENGLTLPQGAAGTVDAPGGANYEAAAARRNKFMDQLHRAVAADALVKKRDLSEEEIQAHATKLFATVSWQREPRGFWEWARATGTPEGKDVVTFSEPLYNAPGADKRIYRIDEMPASALKIMQANDQKNGVTRTPAQMIEAYNAAMMKKAMYAAP
jgi:hypothetical protein